MSSIRSIVNIRLDTHTNGFMLISSFYLPAREIKLYAINSLSRFLKELQLNTNSTQRCALFVKQIVFIHKKDQSHFINVNIKTRKKKSCQHRPKMFVNIVLYLAWDIESFLSPLKPIFLPMKYEKKKHKYIHKTDFSSNRMSVF